MKKASVHVHNLHNRPRLCEEPTRARRRSNPVTKLCPSEDSGLLRRSTSLRSSQRRRGKAVFKGSHTHKIRVQPDIHTMLVDGGLRRTKERVLVLSTLVRLHTPSSVEALQIEVGDTVNKVTLYRMLEQFAGVGLVERVAQPDGVRRYEYQSEHHHHITCTECGVRERVSVPEGTLVRAVAKSAPSFSAITSHTLEFYGRCGVCDVR